MIFYIDGKRMNDVESKERDIAMVFQNYALYPHMTVYENMAFGLKIRKISKEEIDKKVREAAKILDLEKLLDRKPKALPGGQRQRVAMGRAIVRKPKVFLMDEPLSNLDAKLRGQILQQSGGNDQKCTPSGSFKASSDVKDPFRRRTSPGAYRGLPEGNPTDLYSSGSLCPSALRCLQCVGVKGYSWPGARKNGQAGGR